MAVEGLDRRGTADRRGGRGLYREHRDSEGPIANLHIAIIAKRLSRLSLKFIFSRNDNYRDNRVIFSQQTVMV